MAQLLGIQPFRKRQYRTLTLFCDDEPLSDVQLKAYHSRLQEYQTFLDAVSRLALCGNVCITEEAVTIGDHGLLTGESLNALQHAGAISVYNTLQQNNWEFPVAEEGEVAVIKSHNPIPDEFLDSEKPIRSDWPAVHISECFVEGERAKLHGAVRPLRTFLPPTVVFRNAADVDEDIPETELNIPNETGADGSVELVSSAKGITVKRREKNGREEYIPIEEYYFGRQDGAKDYYEEKGDFRFKCAVCQRIFYSNIKLMSHILGHVDENSQVGLNAADVTQCQLCDIEFNTAFDLRAHMEQDHPGVYADSQSLTAPNVAAGPTASQTASQLLLQQRDGNEQTDGATTRVGENIISGGTLACRICGKEASSELALAHHLQSSHREREMPYVCRLCLFRSSLFEDILEHFKKEHDNSNHLLCTYCLRIFTPSDARGPSYSGVVTAAGVHVLGGIGQTQVYLQHLRMHQIRHQLRRCPTCKLNFTNKSDYQVHRRLDHRATRGTSIDKSYDAESTVTAEEATDKVVQHLKNTQPHIKLMNAPEAGQLKNLASLRLPENIDESMCLECNQSLGTAEHRNYFPCSMCRFGTCCSMGYNRHMSRVHVYISGTHRNEPDTGMPLIRPVHFQWMSDEVDAMEGLGKQSKVQGTEGALEDHSSDARELSEVSSSETSREGMKGLLSTCKKGLADASDSTVDSVPNTTLTTSAVPSDAMDVDITDNPQPVPGATGLEDLNQIETHEADKKETRLGPNTTLVTDADDTDITDLLATGEELTAAEKMTNNPVVIENPEIAAPNVDVQPISSSTSLSPPPLAEAPSSAIPDDLKQLQIVMKYMASQLDARRFACTYCAISNLNGNSLARHLVEECSSNSVTLNPNPALVKARLEAEEQFRLQQEMQQNEQNETGILFEATDASMSGAENLCMQGQVSMAGVSNQSDVVMVAMPTDQLSSYGTMDAAAGADQTMANTELVTQVGPTGTTIDVTNAEGEVVQQFIIPDDLQLEEGQTLVVIHGEDGQPQLAIVNQADLIGTEDSRMMLQAEEDTSSMMLYTEGVGHPSHTLDGVPVQRDEEKENHQFVI